VVFVSGDMKALRLSRFQDLPERKNSSGALQAILIVQNGFFLPIEEIEGRGASAPFWENPAFR